MFDHPVGAAASEATHSLQLRGVILWRWSWARLNPGALQVGALLVEVIGYPRGEGAGFFSYKRVKLQWLQG